jgi:hypothetical protein
MILVEDDISAPGIGYRYLNPSGRSEHRKNLVFGHKIQSRKLNIYNTIERGR